MRNIKLVTSLVALVVLFGGGYLLSRAGAGRLLDVLKPVLVLALGLWLLWIAYREVRTGRSMLDASSFDRNRSPGLFWTLIVLQVVFGVSLIGASIVFFLR